MKANPPRSTLLPWRWLGVIVLLLSQLAILAPAAGQAAGKNLRSFTILYTNDEHGWLEKTVRRNGAMLGGVAEMMVRWRQFEDYDPDDSSFLVLSGGDNWTGPAISTLFEGQSTFEVMQAMGYDASAIGNHEFDFGLDLLQERMRSSAFPYVAGNIVTKGTTETADGFVPYTIIKANGVRVALIGLSTVSTPVTTKPDNVASLSFLPYANALKKWVPQARAAGADMIVGLGHICLDELLTLAPVASELGVDLLTGGHCNELVSREVNGVHILVGGKHWRSYARMEVVFDVARDEIVHAEAKLVRDIYQDWPEATADSAIATIVKKWHAKAAKTMDVVIGYTENGVPRPWLLFNLITDAWLAQYPAADIAFTNKGGVRQDLEPGPITIGDIYGVLPFDNALIEVKVTGRDLLENLECCGGIFAGMQWQNGRLSRNDDTPLHPDSTYRVLINDFMYAGGSHYRFHHRDPNGYYTGINYRQPVIDYIKSLNTSPDKPLDNFLDGKNRSLAN